MATILRYNMPTLKDKKNIYLYRVSIFFILVLVCCNQVYRFAHSHHFHKNDSLVFEISYHPIRIAIDHSSSHQHDENSSHPTDNQHKYKNELNWHLPRCQYTSNFEFAAQALFSSPIHLPPPVLEKFLPFYHASFYLKDHHHAFSIIRGPPLLG